MALGEMHKKRNVADRWDAAQVKIADIRTRSMSVQQRYYCIPGIYSLVGYDSY